MTEYRTGWSPTTEITRQQLGSGYLVATTVVLLLVVLAHLVFTADSGLGLAAGAIAAALPLLAVAYLGIAAWRETALVDAAWDVALWFSAGLGVGTGIAMAAGLTGLGVVDGGALPVLAVMALPVGAGTGALVGVITQVRENIEEMRTLDQRNAVQNRVLRHNIRNEMSVVLAHAELLTNGAEAQGDVEEHAEAIRQKTYEVLALSEAARSVNRLAETGATHRLDVARLVQSRLQAARERYDSATLTYEGPSSVEAEVDPLLGRVVENLVENAVVHHDGTPTVTVELAAEDGSLAITVVDDGPGIPSDQASVLFERTEDRAYHGSGLGLWLVKWYVDSHDGEMAVESLDPRGTRVSLSLPVDVKTAG